jgi:hypothetical protein
MYSLDHWISPPSGVSAIGRGILLSLVPHWSYYLSIYLSIYLYKQSSSANLFQKNIYSNDFLYSYLLFFVTVRRSVLSSNYYLHKLILLPDDNVA